MTDLQEKAMRMALERLESHEYWMDEDAIQALRQALAQPKQESVCAHGVEKNKCGFCKQPEQEPVEYKEECWACGGSAQLLASSGKSCSSRCSE